MDRPDIQLVQIQRQTLQRLRLESPKRLVHTVDGSYTSLKLVRFKPKSGMNNHFALRIVSLSLSLSQILQKPVMQFIFEALFDNELVHFCVVVSMKCH